FNRLARPVPYKKLENLNSNGHVRFENPGVDRGSRSAYAFRRAGLCEVSSHFDDESSAMRGVSTVLKQPVKLRFEPTDVNRPLVRANHALSQDTQNVVCIRSVEKLLNCHLISPCPRLGRQSSLSVIFLVMTLLMSYLSESVTPGWLFRFNLQRLPCPGQACGCTIVVGLAGENVFVEAFGITVKPTAAIAVGSLQMTNDIARNQLARFTCIFLSSL